MVKSILAQSYPAASTLTDAYVVPRNIKTTLFTILITNHTALSTTFSISLAPIGAADDPKHYWFKNVKLLANETMDLDMKLVLSERDTIRVLSQNGATSFNVVGLEASLSESPNFFITPS